MKMQLVHWMTWLWQRRSGEIIGVTTLVAATIAVRWVIVQSDLVRR